ncbi:MAG: polysaccharide deacetylase [Lachnospiraceae bacterium]|nr:polysaccharide deacetylase [Lachnospiraceae bacterium]
MTGDTVEKISSDYRRKRVKRIKKIIVTSAIILILLPTVLSVFLLIKVFNMQKQLDKVLEARADKKQEEDVVQAKEKKATPVVTATPVPAEKKVYLTFDDGPGTQTEKILEVLKKEKVKASFFVTGKEDSYSKKMYRRIVKEGHTLGMHSYSHIYSQIYESKEAFTKDFNKIYKTLYKATGTYPTFYRFPGGSSTKNTKIPIQNFIQVLNQNKISYIDWNVISPDATNPGISKSKIIEKIIQDISQYDTSVVLMYDVEDKPMTAKALPGLIRKLKEKNYKLLPIDSDTVSIRHNE